MNIKDIDKNDIKQVEKYVEYLVEDIFKTANGNIEVMIALMKSYMIDLINPKLLNFDE